MFLAEDCREVGYFRDPAVEDCQDTWGADSEYGCYVSKIYLMIFNNGGEVSLDYSV